ncbi:MAG: PLP-dependent aminotransferase family protein [Chloroflexota bacterium]|nr:PLP-dependent aminotransferase family protein [Chloroflexota bacterium]
MPTSDREFNFGAGNPDPGVFPAPGLAHAAMRILPRVGSMLARYPDQRGLTELREVAIERFERSHGLRPPLEQVALTNGSMQCLVLAAQGLARPGSAVIIEEFSYVGTLRIFRQNGLELVPVPLDGQGMRVDVLDDLLARQEELGKKPAFIYTIASCQNPTGTTLPLDRRIRLIDLARKHGVRIVEDDCYADVSFVPQAVPALYKLAEPGEVMYIGSFSKILGPGVRLGYFIAPEPMASELLKWKTDGGTSDLSAMIVAEYFKDSLWGHIEEASAAVKRKRDTLLASLEREFADMDASWTHPDGGLFLWLRLPEAVDRQRLQELAGEQGIIYATGQSFHALDQDVPYLRLAFGWIDNDDIPEGIRRLAECVRRAAARRGFPPARAAKAG